MSDMDKAKQVVMDAVDSMIVDARHAEMQRVMYWLDSQFDEPSFGWVFCQAVRHCLWSSFDTIPDVESFGFSDDGLDRQDYRKCVFVTTPPHPEDEDYEAAIAAITDLIPEDAARSIAMAHWA